jgi:putative endonuclease
MFYVYVLTSKQDGELYTGFTHDLRRRVKEHNAGKVESTKSRTPFTLAYYEAYKSEDEARNREKALKRRGQAKVHLCKRIQESVTLSQADY